MLHSKKVLLALVCTVFTCNMVNTEAAGLKALAELSEQPTYQSTGTVFYVEGDGTREVYTAGLDNLCVSVGNEIGINPEYIKAIALRMSPTYITREPDIMRDASMKQLTELEVKRFPQFTEENENRGTVYCLPDALYTVGLELQKLIEERKVVAENREEMQELYVEAYDKVIFYEAFEQLYSKDEMPLENIVKIYTEILQMKDANEYVVNVTDKGVYTIADKFKPIFGKYGIPYTEILAQAMSLDATLMHAASEYAIKERKDPYVYGLTTRENMMLAACGLIGKVRYVWGGGHGLHNMKGYSPLWFAFNELYEEHEDSNISPGGSWCPIHGYTGNCAFTGEKIRTVSDYREIRKDLLENTTFYSDIESNLSQVYPNEVISTYPIDIHRVEGLDCSGFCSWLYNQIDTTRVYDSNAAGFVSNGGLTVIDRNTDTIKTGDIISWSSHVVTVVGTARPSVYIAVESTAYTVKLGVYYSSGATQEDIDYAENLAKTYNYKIGNIDKSMFVNRLNIDSLGVKIGRLPRPYEDEDKIIYEGKTLLEMSAEELLEYIYNALPNDYKVENTIDEEIEANEVN